MSEVTTRDRFRGCLLGLAAGDALGTTLEFKRPCTFKPIHDMIGGGPFGLKPGQWTDDTSMALCLGQSLIECGRFDPKDQMRRYVLWWHDGYLSSTEGPAFDIGNTVADALSYFLDTCEPYAGSTDAMSAGNGSLMRLAPVPMYFAGDAGEAIDRSADSSRTTHGAEEAVDACRYFSGLLIGALKGVNKETLLSAHYCLVEGLWERSPLAEKIAEIADGSFKHRNPPDCFFDDTFPDLAPHLSENTRLSIKSEGDAQKIKGKGYVVKSLEAALWAFHKSCDFRDGALLAVNLGDDADTTGAIYGQIAGAYYGAEAIPAEWRERLTMSAEITDMADSIYDHALQKRHIFDRPRQSRPVTST